MLNAIAGHDRKDSTSVDMIHPDYLEALQAEVKGMHIGLPEEYFGEGIDPAVEAQVKSAAALLESLGAVVEYCSLPHTRYAMPAYYLIAPAEASSNLARYDGVRYGLRIEEKDVVTSFKATRSQGFGPEVKRRIMLGTYALSAGYYDAYYLKALKVRNLIKQDYDRVFEKFDCLITPTAPSTALTRGQNMDPLELVQAGYLHHPQQSGRYPGTQHTLWHCRRNAGRCAAFGQGFRRIDTFARSLCAGAKFCTDQDQAKSGEGIIRWNSSMK